MNAFKRYVVSNPLHPDVFPGTANVVHKGYINTDLRALSHSENGGRGCCHVSPNVCWVLRLGQLKTDCILHRYNHPNGAGATTSGGTESILMSCKTHREWARDVKGITEPEMYVYWW